MATPVGVDGCPGGWVAVWEQGSQLCASVLSRADELDLADALVAIDVPIGLAGSGRRRCDVLAREALGARRNSVFFPPPRAVIECREGPLGAILEGCRLSFIEGQAAYRQALAICAKVGSLGISKQALYICSKIAEIDRATLPVGRWFEVHPEVSFAGMAGHALSSGKKSAEGRAERLALVGEDRFEVARAQVLRGQVKDDDIVDALACLWTAQRLARGEATPLPDPPEIDPSGRPMAIWV